MKVLLLEGIHPLAKTALEAAGYEVQLEAKALGEAELVHAIRGVHALGIRSKTRVTPAVLDAADELLVVGAFCIGTNQIALDAAHLRGVPVFNAPYSNTRSVAELILAELIALSRKLAHVSAKVHRGEWPKSAKGAREVRGKTLGIVGYGHIGSQLSVLAEAIGFKVSYFDIVKKLPLGNARAADSLEDLLRTSDFVTLHVPETPQTKEMIGARELGLMKPGSYLLNASRGTVVVIPALAEALRAGKLAGAAVDVFPHEPESNETPFTSELQGLDNVILTPHIGGSTEEAQEAIGSEVTDSFLRFLRAGATSGSVNFPQVDIPPVAGTHRVLNVHRNVPGVLGAVNGIVSGLGANIQAQALSTDAHLGYLVMDIAMADAAAVRDRVAALETSIKTRLVY